MLQLAVAGPAVRALAWSIDVAIRGIVLIALYVLLFDTLVDEDSFYTSAGIALMVQFALSWLYMTVFEATTSTTPGKYLYRLRVVHDNATPLTASGAIIRNFLRAVDVLPWLNLTGLVCMLLDNRFRRLGDLAAGTLVIYRDQQPTTTTFNHDRATPPPLWFSRDDRQAIVDFAERTEHLSTDRQAELAAQLQHLFDADTDPVDTLKSWALWILRGQESAPGTGQTQTHAQSTNV